MAKHRIVGASLLSAFLVLTGPNATAGADPGTGPDLSDPIVADYMQTVSSIMKQYNSPTSGSSQMSPDQLRQQLTAASDEFRDALVARLPKP
jgi:hypothetical protein